MTYLEMLRQNLADEVEATRAYGATLALAPPGDKAAILELFGDETDHIAIVAGLISQQTGEPVDYAKMIQGVE